MTLSASVHRCSGVSVHRLGLHQSASLRLDSGDGRGVVTHSLLLLAEWGGPSPSPLPAQPRLCGGRLVSREFVLLGPSLGLAHPFHLQGQAAGVASQGLDGGDDEGGAEAGGGGDEGEEAQMAATLMQKVCKTAHLTALLGGVEDAEELLRSTPEFPHLKRGVEGGGYVM